MPEAGISRSFFDVPPENGITMTVSELKRLKGLEEENRRLKQIVGEQAVSLPAGTLTSGLIVKGSN